MGKGLKMLIVGAVFGLLAVFAFIGVKSMLGNRPMVTRDNGFIAIPPQGSLETSNSATTDTGQDASSQDTPATVGEATDLNTFTLEGEQTPDNNPTTDNNHTDAAQAAANNPSTQPDTRQFVLVEEYGQLNLTVDDPDSTTEEGEFLIYDQQGLQVASSSGGTTASFELEPGQYRVTVSANGKESTRNLGIFKDKITNARFELPANPATNQRQNQQSAPTTATESDKGQLLVYVRAAESNSPVKANIYVQTSNGQHVAKKNYDENADFLLPAGTYRITVKAKNRQDMGKTVRIGAGGSLRETFAMRSTAATASGSRSTNTNQPQAQSQSQTPAPSTSTAPAPAALPADGTLKMSLDTTEGLPQRARFIIHDKSGVRLADLGPANTAELQLPPGSYDIEIDFGSRAKRTHNDNIRSIDIVSGKTSMVTFNAADFVMQTDRPARPVRPLGGSRQQSQQQAPVTQQNHSSRNPATQTQQAQGQEQGLLQLNAVSSVDGSPVQVNFSVSTPNGRLIHNLNSVATAEVDVPIGDIIVAIHYKDLTGSERITIKPNEPTTYTFTILPPEQTQQSGSTEQILIDQIQQEIFRRLNQ